MDKKNFKIGQIWKTRSGHEAQIVWIFKDSLSYRVLAVHRYSDSYECDYRHRLDGKVYSDQDNKVDLISLVSEPEEKGQSISILCSPCYSGRHIDCWKHMGKSCDCPYHKSDRNAQVDKKIGNKLTQPQQEAKELKLKIGKYYNTHCNWKCKVVAYGEIDNLFTVAHYYDNGDCAGIRYHNCNGTEIHGNRAWDIVSEWQEQTTVTPSGNTVTITRQSESPQHIEQDKCHCPTGKLVLFGHRKECKK